MYLRFGELKSQNQRASEARKIHEAAVAGGIAEARGERERHGPGTGPAARLTLADARLAASEGIPVFHASTDVNGSLLYACLIQTYRLRIAP